MICNYAAFKKNPEKLIRTLSFVKERRTNMPSE
jgi:hypothetical protein